MCNTTVNGLPFDLATKKAVWQRCDPLRGTPGTAKEIRTDVCGAAIRWEDHGDTDSMYGWEVDHILPKSQGGGDDLDNLQALHWQNNRQKGDSLVSGLWFCVMRA